jgi:hypothetical protein
MLLGMMRVSGVDPVRTLTGAAAVAVTGRSAAMTKVVTSRERALKVKVSLQIANARVFDARRST